MHTSGAFTIPKMHEDFSLDGQSCTIESLKIVAKSYSIHSEIHKQEVGAFLLDWGTDKDHIVVKTSGSTGIPKNIKVYKQQMIDSAKATGEFFKTKEKTTALLCLPTRYIAGKMMLVRAMVLGWKLDIVAPKTNPLHFVNSHYDFCAMVPMQLSNSIHKLHLIKKLIVGGGAVSESLKKQVLGVSTKIYETYGMTETVTHVAARELNPKSQDSYAINYFTVLPNITLSTDDRDCLVINAPLLNSELVITNDVVELKTDKKFHWKGRFDNVINSGGLKLHPEQIEKKIQAIVKQRFFIIGISDRILGHKAVLIIEDKYDSILERNVLQFIREQEVLTKHEIPKSIYFVSKFMETETGKIQRSATLAFALKNNQA